MVAQRDAAVAAFGVADAARDQRRRGTCIRSGAKHAYWHKTCARCHYLVQKVTMSHRQAAVWLDHVEARICRIDPQELASVSAPHPHVKPTANEHADHSQQRAFFAEIAALLKGTDALLVLGPSTTKLDFVRHLQRHDPALEAKITAVESLEQPTDALLLAHVRHYFRRTVV